MNSTTDHQTIVFVPSPTRFETFIQFHQEIHFSLLLVIHQVITKEIITVWGLETRSLFLFRLRRYIKHERQCFIRFPNTSNFVKNTPLRVVISTLFSVFGNRMKHYLIYYFKDSFLVLERLSSVTVKRRLPVLPQGREGSFPDHLSAMCVHYWSHFPQGDPEVQVVLEGRRRCYHSLGYQKVRVIRVVPVKEIRINNTAIHV